LANSWSKKEYSNGKLGEDFEYIGVCPVKFRLKKMSISTEYIFYPLMLLSATSILFFIISLMIFK